MKSTPIFGDIKLKEEFRKNKRQAISKTIGKSNRKFAGKCFLRNPDTKKINPKRIY